MPTNASADPHEPTVVTPLAEADDRTDNSEVSAGKTSAVVDEKVRVFDHEEYVLVSLSDDESEDESAKTPPVGELAAMVAFAALQRDMSSVEDKVNACTKHKQEEANKSSSVSPRREGLAATTGAAAPRRKVSVESVEEKKKPIQSPSAQPELQAILNRRRILADAAEEAATSRVESSADQAGSGSDGIPHPKPAHIPTDQAGCACVML
jgi:hypothetical protein